MNLDFASNFKHSKQTGKGLNIKTSYFKISRLPILKCTWNIIKIRYTFNKLVSNFQRHIFVMLWVIKTKFIAWKHKKKYFSEKSVLHVK